MVSIQPPGDSSCRKDFVFERFGEMNIPVSSRALKKRVVLQNPPPLCGIAEIIIYDYKGRLISCSE